MPGYKVIAAEAVKSGLVCPECDLVLKDAVLTSDGSLRLCESCYHSIARQPGYTSKKTGLCVADEEDGKPFRFPDKAARRDVQQLEVQCNNWKAGCKWVGQLGSYFKGHESECHFKPTPCPNCGEKVQRDQMDEHRHEECRLRKDQCEHCGKKLVHHKMQEHHKVCKKFPLRCEHCQEEVCRENMKQHKDNDCRHVKCSCGEVLNRHTSEKDPKSVLAHFKNPATLLSHITSLQTTEREIIDKMKHMVSRLTAIENGSIPVTSLQNSNELSRFRKDIDRKFRDYTEQLIPLQELHISGNSKNLSSKVQELNSRLAALEQKVVGQEFEIMKHMSESRPSDVTRHNLLETENRSTAAVDAFKELTAALLSAISESEILPLATALYSKGVISKFDLEEAMMIAHTPTGRKVLLLHAIEAKITSAPWKLKVVLDILRDNSFCLSELAERIQLSYNRRKTMNKTENADSAAETPSGIEEGIKSCHKEGFLRKGIRKLYGAARDMTSALIKRVLKSLNVDIHVFRKYKKRFDKRTNCERVRWWFEIWGDESALTALESNWDKVVAETKWRLETCPVVSHQC